MRNLKHVDLDDVRQESYYTVTNKVVFKYLHFVETGLCGYCAPNRGCNRARKPLHNNWKEHRKTQYKIKDNDNS